MTRVKICGLTNPDDVRIVTTAGADAIGVVTDVPVDSPREVEPQRAVDVLDAVPPFVTTVMVTMQNDPERVLELVQSVTPDAVQLHGDLPPGDIAFLGAQIQSDIIRALPANDDERARAHDGVVDAVLLDAPGTERGGTGRSHDWQRVAHLIEELRSPVVLAGGLTPKNVGEAAKIARPFAVDVASGVERTGGQKDADAVQSFVKNVRRDRVVS